MLLKINLKKNFRLCILLGLLVGTTAFILTSDLTADASGTITGRVFQDYNANGSYDSTGGTLANPTSVDVGIQSVTVTVFDSSGVSRGTTASAADGTYTLAATGTGPYRVEFTNIPAGFSPSARSNDSVGAGTASNSGSTVHFVTDGNTSNVNLAVNRPEEYCQNNPSVLVACYVKGAQNGGNQLLDALVDFPYWAGTVYTDPVSANYDIPSAHPITLRANQIGPTYSLAYAKITRRVFASAYFKKHVGFGPGADGTFNNSDDPGAIYIINPATNAVTGAFTVPNATTNSHDTANYDTDNNDIGWDAAGKTSLGGTALSTDETRLYVMNLQNRTLYALNTTTGAVLASQAVPTAGIPTPGGTAANCAAGDVRPFAVKYYRDQVYVGMVCSGESTQNVTNLRAYIYQVNPTTLAFGGSPIFQTPLNYTRGLADPGATAAWRPWFATRVLRSTSFSYAQAIVSDIEFDESSVTLGLRDRVGDQANDYDTYAKRTAGDVIKGCGAFGAWTTESNGRCAGGGTAPQGTNQGPGGGEFFFQDDFSNPANGGQFHDDIAWGATLRLPGGLHVLSIGLDPISRFIDPTATFDGGVRWYNTTTGATNRAYRVYNGPSGSTPPDLGKANGLGDMVALCNAAPIEIGNRVWNDANRNGIQDPGEATIQNVSVQLWADTDNNGSIDTQIGTATTNANGHYVFGGVGNVNLTGPNTVNQNNNYEIRIPSTNFNGGQPLNGFVPTIPDADVSANGDSRDSDGIVISGNQVVKAFSTGSAGENNHAYDFGFNSGANVYSVGNRVWFDTNNDGRINAAEVGIGGISVSLFVDGNSDGQPDTPGTPVATMLTDATGYYRFDGLNAGTFVIRVNPLNFAGAATLFGHQNTTGNTTGDVDSDLTNAGENGVNPIVANSILTNGILSNTITLGPGTSEPVNETDLSGTGQGSLDNLADMTVDFGFYCIRLSGTLWNDTGAGPFNNNGMIDPGETRIPNITVRLFTAAGVEVATGLDGILGTADDLPSGVRTDASGNYSFSCLPQGQYRVVVQPGGGSGTSSTPTSITPDDNIDNDDNGFPGTGQFNARIISGLVTLTPGSTGALGNNTVTNPTGSTSNPTVDFGFIVAPTFITLNGFEVNSNGSQTEITWSTAEEYENLGFNIYREVNGKRELVNRSMIAGGFLKSSASLALTADNYNWVDESPKGGAVYYLEDIDLKGNTTIHGPVYPKMKFSASSFNRNAILLGDLTRSVDSFGEKEYAGSEQTAASETPNLHSSNGERQMEIASQKGAKITVDRDGWYRISATELALTGFNIDSNRDQWQLFANGEEVSIKTYEDGSIEFFGTGNDKVSTAKKVYYLIEGNRMGRRVETVDGGSSDVENAALSFETTTVREDRQTYISSIRNGEGKNFFGSMILTTGPTIQELTVRNPESIGGVKLRVKLQGLTSGNHLVGVRLNGFDLGTVSYLNDENRSFEYDLPRSFITEGINQVQLQSVGSGTDISLVDSISLTYQRKYLAFDDQLKMTVPAGQGVRIGGFDTGRLITQVKVFEVENGLVGRELLTELVRIDGKLGISLGPVSRDRELLVIAQNRMQLAVKVERNNPSNWRDSQNRADLVIIAPQALLKNAEQLAEMRRAQKLETEVVLTEDIYDEFGFGENSPEAIREFLRTATTTWQNRPRYALLFGDSSFDPRNYLGGQNNNLVPTKLFDSEFQETGSDSWLADFNDDGVEDIALGRLPAGNTTEAGILISKLASYEAQEARQVSSVLVSDNGFSGYIDQLQAELPANALVSRIERSAMTDSEMRTQIINRLSNGPMLVTYTGHGSTGLWASQNVFTLYDASAITSEKLSIYLMMTCLNGYSLNRNFDSISESFLKNANGGAIAVWASTGSTFPDAQLEISRSFTRDMFAQTNVRLGDLMRQSKLSTANQDVRRTWHLIGDPTIFVK